MAAISTASLTTPQFSCLYNREFFNEEEAADLLGDNAEKLFLHQQALTHANDYLSYKLTVAGTTYYAKEFKLNGSATGPLHSLREPAARACYRAAELLVTGGFRAPEPVMAVVLDRGARQLLLNVFCAGAMPLDQGLQDESPYVRREVLAEVSDLLSELLAKNFYAPALRAADILFEQTDHGRRYWLTDFGGLTVRRLRIRRLFAATVANVCTGVYDGLEAEERSFFFASCFDMALKKNIFTRPSQQGAFIDHVVNDLKLRHKLDLV
jgi:hypothetical protein